MVLPKVASINQAQRNSQYYKKLSQQLFSSSHHAYQKLSEYRGFERRLLDMLNQVNQEDTEQRLVIHQRLGRCRQAISKVEREIELLEKKRL